MDSKTVNHKDIEFPRFPFQRFGSTGLCYIRVRQRPEDLVVFCAQLVPYRGTSITDAVGSIFLTLMARLREDGVSLPRKLDKIIQRVSWIEHYPRTPGLALGDMHAIVKFDSRLNAIWHFVSKEDAAFKCNVPKSFLKINKSMRASKP